MERFIKISAILIIAFGTLGSAYNCGNNRVENDIVSKKEKREQRWEQTVRQSVVKSTKRWKGVVELTGHNDHPMITIAMHLCGLSGDKGYAWCAACVSEILDWINIVTAPITARAREFFDTNVNWDRRWNTPIPHQMLQPGMLVGYRLNGKWDENHVEILILPTKRIAYVAGGNTSPKGEFNPNTFELIGEAGTSVARDADGFYYKARYWHQIDVIADYCLTGEDWKARYSEYLKSVRR